MARRNFVDRCIFRAAGTGTGTFTVSSAITGYMTPATAGAVDGQSYAYAAESDDLSQWEVGLGVYTSSGATLTRATIYKSSTGGSAVSFTAAPKVTLTVTAADMADAADPTGNTTITLADDSSTVGPILTVARTSTTPAQWDTLGAVRFNGSNVAGSSITYGTVTSRIANSTPGSEAGQLQLQAFTGGGTYTVAEFGADYAGTFYSQQYVNYAILTSTIYGSGSGPIFYMTRYPGVAPADGDYGPSVIMQQQNSSLVMKDTAKIISQFETVTAGSEKSRLYFDIQESGSTVTRLTVNTAGVTTNGATMHAVLRPSSIAGTYHNYAPTGHENARTIVLTPTAFTYITGLAGGVDGRVVHLINASEDYLIELGSENASSTAANRFLSSGTYDGWIDSKMGITLVYDGTAARWRYASPTYTWAGSASMEAASAYFYFVSPALQHRHPSAAKCWGRTTGAGTPVLGASYNVTSIADTGGGRLTVTIGTDFSSTDWAGTATATCVNNANRMVSLVSKAAGTVELQTSSAATTLADPGVGWDWAFYGDQ